MCDDDDGCCGGPALVIGGILTFIAVLLICILVPLTFSYIDINNIGFQKGRTTGTVDTSKAYSMGRYAWGVTTTSTQFSNKWQYQDFTGGSDFTVFSDAGQMTIDVSFYWYITTDGFPYTYQNFGSNYPNTVKKTAQDAIKNAAANLTVVQYQTQRAAIAQMLYNNTATQLYNQMRVVVPPTGFFFGHFNLPSQVLSKRITAFQNEQTVITQGYQQQAAQIRLVTQTNVTSVNQQASLVLQDATILAAAMRTEASNSAQAATQTETGRQLGAMLTALGLKDKRNATEALVRYLSLLDQQSTSTPKLIADFKPTIRV